MHNFCVGVSLPGSPVCWAFAVFLLERHGGKFFVELEPLIVLIHVGLDFLFERRKGKCFVELARLIFLFRVGLEQLFVGFGLSGFPVSLLGFRNFLLERR